MFKISLGGVAAVMILPVLATAQERSAMGAIDTQVTWSALRTMVDAANTKSDAVNARMDQVVVCGKKGMVYAPGATSADGDGCLSAGGGKGCVMDVVAVCGSTTNCRVAVPILPYKLNKNNGNTTMPVPTNWQNGEMYIWKYADTNNNKGGGQCIDGTMHYLDRLQ